MSKKMPEQRSGISFGGDMLEAAKKKQ